MTNASDLLSVHQNNDADAVTSPRKADEALPGESLVLPEDPIVIIEASKSWASLQLRDLWNYRELLYFLTWRDVKVRYKQTLLGAAWAILQPLLTMVIFTLLFGRLAGIKSEGIPYPIFAYAGLLIWIFFANSVTNGGKSLVSSAHLITKIYFPRMIIPAGAVAAGLVDLALAFLIQIALMIYYSVHVTWALVMVPPLVLLTTLLAVGVGLWLSALNVKYRDVRYAIPFLLQLLVFASPLGYSATEIHGLARIAFAINPVTGIAEGFRWVVLGLSPPPLVFLIVPTLGTGTLLLTGLLYF